MLTNATATDSDRRQSRRTARIKSRRHFEKSNVIYQSLFNRIQALGFNSSGNLRTLGLTSCLPREGVSTVASNLAVYAAACQNTTTVIVDGNIGNPSLHKIFEVDLAPGLTCALKAQVPLEQCIQETSFSDLYVVAAGENRHAILKPDEVSEKLDCLATECDLILVDLPAMTAPRNWAALMRELDGVIVVLETERITDDAAQRHIRSLRESGANLLGVTLNKYRSPFPRWVDRIR